MTVPFWLWRTDAVTLALRKPHTHVDVKRGLVCVHVGARPSGTNQGKLGYIQLLVLEFNNEATRDLDANYNKLSL